jgi:hypothetical protein
MALGEGTEAESEIAATTFVAIRAADWSVPEQCPGSTFREGKPVTNLPPSFLGVFFQLVSAF